MITYLAILTLAYLNSRNQMQNDSMNITGFNSKRHFTDILEGYNQMNSQNQNGNGSLETVFINGLPKDGFEACYDEHDPLIDWKGTNSTGLLLSHEEVFTQEIEFIRKIGEGYTGSVYQVRDRRLGLGYEDFVCKVISKNVNIRVTASHIVNEIHAAVHLPVHPNLVKIYRYFQDADNIYLIMERSRGKTLFSFMNMDAEDPKANSVRVFSEKETRKIFKQMVDTLMLLGNKGMFYNDIKPQNIMITEDLQVMIIDYGLLYKDNNPRVLIVVPGRPPSCYLPPERYVQTPLQPKKAQVWYLGILLYQLYFGYDPFGKKTSKNYVKRLLNLKFRPLGLKAFNKKPPSEDFVDLFEKMIQYESERISLEEVSSHPWMKKED